MYIFSPECNKELGEFVLMLATVNPSLAINVVRTLQGSSSHSISSDLSGDQGLITTEQPGCFQRTNWALSEIRIATRNLLFWPAKIFPAVIILSCY